MDILDTLKSRFLATDRNLWEPIADAAGVGRHFPRKMVYGDRKRPGIDTCQKLLNFFDGVDTGRIAMPAPAEPKAKRERAAISAATKA